MREHGVAVAGPDPKTLIDPISAEDIRAAVAGELRARMEDGAIKDEPPAWLGSRYYQAFEIETLCRALHTLDSGELPTKAQAVEWALGTLPERWRSLVGWSQQHRADKTADASKIPEIMSFTRWAASRSYLYSALPGASRDAIAGRIERLLSSTGVCLRPETSSGWSTTSTTLIARPCVCSRRVRST